MARPRALSTAVALLALTAAGCPKDPPPTADPPATSVTATSAAAPSASATGRPRVLCTQLLAGPEISAKCGRPIRQNSMSPSDDLGPSTRCSRLFVDEAVGGFSFLVEDRGDGRAALAPPPDAKNVRPIKGLGDEARAYDTTNAAGNKVEHVELRKGPFSARVESSACTAAGVEALAYALASRLP
jgi:hypothetical protein